MFRGSWDSGIRPTQWNVTVSEPGVLRGVHVHLEHTDYLAVIEGRADVGLYDARPGSPTRGLASLVGLHAEAMAGLTIPPGVFHGLHFHERSVFLYGLSHEWTPEDDLACRWDDPAMGIPWRGPGNPRVSSRDLAAPGLTELLAEIGSSLPVVPGPGARGS